MMHTMEEEDFKGDALRKIINHIMKVRGGGLKKRFDDSQIPAESVSMQEEVPPSDSADPNGIKVSSLEIMGDEAPELASELTMSEEPMLESSEEAFLPDDQVEEDELEELMRELGVV